MVFTKTNKKIIKYKLQKRKTKVKKIIGGKRPSTNNRLRLNKSARNEESTRQFMEDVERILDILKSLPIKSTSPKNTRNFNGILRGKELSENIKEKVNSMLNFLLEYYNYRDENTNQEYRMTYFMQFANEIIRNNAINEMNCIFNDVHNFVKFLVIQIENNIEFYENNNTNIISKVIRSHKIKDFEKINNNSLQYELLLFNKIINESFFNKIKNEKIITSGYRSILC